MELTGYPFCYGIRRFAAACIACGFGVAIPGADAAAQEAPRDFRECAAIAADAARLACYDALVKAATAASPGKAQAAVVGSSGTPTPAPALSPAASAPADIRTEQEQEFGRTAKRPAKEPKEAKEISVIIVSVRWNKLGRGIFTTEGGQIWRQVDKTSIHIPKTAFSARIKKGMLGSYFLTVEGSRASIRVKRLN